MADLIDRQDVPDTNVGDMISRQAVIKAFKDFLTIHDSRGVTYLCSAVTMDGVYKILSDLPSADTDLSDFSDKLWKTAYERGKAEAVRWIPCGEMPDTDRNVFIARGNSDMMTVCVGHYDNDLKQWYEDRNWFAKCLYDGLYWCEMPPLPETYKDGEQDG